MPQGKRTGDRASRKRPFSRRIRAARAYTGLERPSFALLAGIPKERLNYLENGKGEPEEYELAKIQQASGVPMSFLQHGFDYDEGVATESIDRRLGELARQVEEDRETLKAWISRLEVERPAPSTGDEFPDVRRGELGRLAEGRRRDSEDPPQTGLPEEEEPGQTSAG